MKLVMLTIGALSLAAFHPSSAPPKLTGAAPMNAKLISLDGTSRTIVLDGVGCSASMCSRIFIRGKSEDGPQEQILLNTISSIQHGNVFRLRNGVERRLSLVPDFRVLYFTNRHGGEEKIDLADVKSVEFLASPGDGY